jgi:hypothetical protein
MCLSRPGIIDARDRYRAAARRLGNTVLKEGISPLTGTAEDNPGNTQQACSSFRNTFYYLAPHNKRYLDDSKCRMCIQTNNTHSYDALQINTTHTARPTVTSLCRLHTPPPTPPPHHLRQLFSIYTQRHGRVSTPSAWYSYGPGFEFMALRPTFQAKHIL